MLGVASQLDSNQRVEELKAVKCITDYNYFINIFAVTTFIILPKNPKWKKKKKLQTWLGCAIGKKFEKKLSWLMPWTRS